jgi:hypothetical protein
VGVGDVGTVPGGAWCSGHSAGGDDGGGAWRERERDILCGRGEFERDAAVEPGWDWVGVGDGARVGSGSGLAHGAGSSWTDRMRGDGVGVGDVGAVPGGAWCSGHSAGCDDGGGARRERERDVLCGRGEFECDAAIESGWDGVGVGDGARVWSWAGGVYGAGADRADGMRGD